MLKPTPPSYDFWHEWLVPPIVIPALIIAFVVARALYLYL